MQVDVIIVGQGISGSLLSWFLKKEGKSFIILDNGKKNTASKISAGIINPVTGRRYVTTWMIEELLEFAETTYSEIETYLGENIFTKKSIIDFFPSAQMRDAFIERMAKDDTYLHSFPDQNYFNSSFKYSFGCGEVKPVISVSNNTLLTKWNEELKVKNFLLEETFKKDDLKIIDGGIQYNHITADKIIFCDGIESLKNQWFHQLPFSANKGEALIVHCEGLNENYIFKKGMMLVPLQEKDTYWLGSSYQWEFGDGDPSPDFLKKSTAILKSWLKLPHKIIDHKAAIRPATLERRPFVGFHPLHNQIGILNGMGTKGSSLAPFFAHQLVQHIVYNFPISEEADIRRYNRTLLNH